MIDQATHSHVYLGEGHEKNERKTWAVIALCSAMMVLEIGGGSLFGSLALVADGLHMSTHAAAMLIAAIAYTYARKHASDPSFAFGTGKIGDLAGFSSAIILVMIALLIGYEAVSRLFDPVAINLSEAIPIAVLGLLVNIASAWLLSGGGHHHGHGHAHGADHPHSHDGAPPHIHPHERNHHAPMGHDQGPARIATLGGTVLLEVHEDGVPPRFRVRFEDGNGPAVLPGGAPEIETVRPDGTRRRFTFIQKDAYWESVDEVPEPHQFSAHIHLSASFGPVTHEVSFREDEHGHDDHHAHGDAHKDHNMRAAFVHVLADAAVSVLAILGLLAAKFLGWTFMDPVMGIIGMLVIANWSYGLIRDTGAILLDKTPDEALAAKIRAELEADGDRLTDLHLWRLGPGHLGGIISIATNRHRDTGFYRERLARFRALSHLTIEIRSV